MQHLADKAQRYEKSQLNKLAFLCAGENADDLAAVTAAATKTTTTAATATA